MKALWVLCEVRILSDLFYVYIDPIYVTMSELHIASTKSYYWHDKGFLPERNDTFIV